MKNQLKPIIFSFVLFTHLLTPSIVHTESTLPNITIQALMDDQIFATINGEQISLLAGEQHESITLIKSNSREAMLDIDGQHYRYSLDEGISTSFSGDTSSNGPASLRLYADDNGMYRTPGRIKVRCCEAGGGTRAGNSGFCAGRVLDSARRPGKEDGRAGTL